MIDPDDVNEKLNSVIEWLLNDLPLINKDTKDKLLDRLPLMSYLKEESFEDNDLVLKIIMCD
ncbi:hypothetical protein LCGC14_0912580 [marine sediment metagenome]|uniref:Uncharacterized protein n=1 Tax=marine sediment metagenome TaxID=412755 RepID=A0A0F9NT20_9ZZZZ